MSTFPYNEIAALLIEDSAALRPDDHRHPTQAADSIVDAFSLTRLREYVHLHLTIDATQGSTTGSSDCVPASTYHADRDCPRICVGRSEGGLHAYEYDTTQEVFYRASEFLEPDGRRRLAARRVAGAPA